MTVSGVLKKTVVTLVVLVLLLAIAALLVLRALTEPDRSKFGNVKDEAAAAGYARTDFPGARDDYFTSMDKGILEVVASAGGGEPRFADEIVKLANATGLDPATVREHAIKGQNTWIAWTGGNDLFWDYLANNSAGAFDLLKILSSHPSQAYGRRNRWHYLGLSNEPCFTEATAESAAAEDFGLWLDRRDDESCPPDPFGSAAAYPGVKTGARGQTVTLKDGRQVELAVGSYYGEPSGIVGLRLFSNPAFDQEAAERWDPERYYTDPEYYQDKNLVRPYRVGMSCGFCHVGPNPVNPPPDPEAPEWQHLNSNPGAQYFWLDRIFFWNTRPRSAPGAPSPNEHNIIFQVFHTNPPGALDTSLVSTDYINNPRTMNAVYNVGARLEPTKRWGKELLVGDERANKQFQDYPQTQAFANFWNAQTGETHTARVLKDGADSVGILGALNRVYINIGLFSEEWLLHFRPIIGGQKISPIRIEDAQRNSAYWGATEDQTADMAIFFLVTATPDDLEDAVDGRGLKHLLPESDPTVERGKMLFAENCAACHSSKIPDAPEGSGIDEGICADGGNGPHYRQCWDRYWGWAQTDEFKARMRDIAARSDFLDDNFLSTERRVPVDVLGTNACSPLATNALEGDVWDNFSSSSYKQLPAVGELTVHHPVSGGVRSLQPLGAGRGYTRPASLVSLWTSGPYLLSNSVGHDEYERYGGRYERAGYDSGTEPEYGAPGTPDYGRRKPYAPSYGARRAYPDATAAREDDPAAYGAASTAGGMAGSYGQGYGQEYGQAKGISCPAPDDSDPYLPCVDNRMRVFNDSIRKMLYPERRRVDAQTELPVPGYIYRTTALSCAKVANGYLPGIIQSSAGVLHRLAPWAFDEGGNLALGPLPRGFPINTLTNTKILPDNDEPDGLGHYWQLLKAGPTLLRTFKKLGGACSEEELRDPGMQMHAERVLRETGMIDTLVGLSKCPDYVVNRGHTFGSNLEDTDKKALIEYLKHL